MQDFSRNLDIVSRAAQRSRPGVTTWLGLLLFAGAIPLAVELRGTVVDWVQYREVIAEPASLAILDRTILGVSAVLAVAGSVLAWRLFWTVSLVGTMTMGISDVAALVAGRVSGAIGGFRDALPIIVRHLGAGVAPLARALTDLAANSRYLWNMLAVLTRRLHSGCALVWRRVWMVTASKSAPLRTALVTIGTGLLTVGRNFFASVRAGLTWATSYAWIEASTLIFSLGLIAASAARISGRKVAVLFHYAARFITKVARPGRTVMSITFFYLSTGLAGVVRRLSTGATGLLVGLRRGLAGSVAAAVELGLMFVTLIVFVALAAVRILFALSVPIIYLGIMLVAATRHLSTGVAWVLVGLSRISSATARPAGLAMAAILKLLGRALVLGTAVLLSATSAIFVFLEKGLVWTVRHLWSGVARVLVGLSRMLRAASTPVGLLMAALLQLLGRALALGTAILLSKAVAPFVYLARGLVRSLSVASATLIHHLGRTVDFGIRTLAALFLYLARASTRVAGSLRAYAMGLLVGLRRSLALVGRPVGRGFAVFARNQKEGVRDSVRRLRIGMANASHGLRAGLQLSRGILPSALAGLYRAKAGLRLAIVSIVMTAGVLVLSPLLAVRLAVDGDFRRESVARLSRLLAFLKARPAVGLVCIGVMMSLGYGLFWLSKPATTVEVLIWTSGEKQDVMLPALNRLNAGSHTLTVDGRRYRVRARSVAVDSAKMHAYLVASLTQGTDFPDRTGGAPTVVSPSTSGWLAQVNHDTGQQVFLLDWLRPIVRTPVVIFTYRGMAECLGWPQRPVGWAEIIALAESPQGWAACPTARPEWGNEPLVAFADPAVSSTGRSTLQILHAVAAGKSAEQLTVADIEDPKVRDFVRRL